MNKFLLPNIIEKSKIAEHIVNSKVGKKHESITESSLSELY